MVDERLFRPYIEAATESRSRAPLYYQLYATLKGMILEGALGLGEQVPTEEQLANDALKFMKTNVDKRWK